MLYDPWPAHTLSGMEINRDVKNMYTFKSHGNLREDWSTLSLQLATHAQSQFTFK